jgi:hypothetical protein
MAYIGNMETKGEKIDVGERRYTLCQENENVVPILLQCNEMRRWREQFLDYNGYI